MTAKRADDLLTWATIILIVAELWFPEYYLYWLGGAGVLAVVWITLWLKKVYG